jgi:predicted RNA-binding protein (TIGR00451 family)
MSQKYRRYTLKSKESRQILTDVAEKLKVELGIIADPKASVETMEADFGALLLVNGKPLLFNMGAIRYVCNGADIMAPGIVRYEDAFDKGDVVVVVDVTHGKPLALGEALYESNQAKATRQGPIVKSKHHVGDKIWNFAKTVLE